MMPEMLLEISMVRKCLVTRNSLLRIHTKTAEEIVETEMIEVTEAIAETEVIVVTEEVIAVIAEIEEIAKIEVIAEIEQIVVTEEETEEIEEETETIEEEMTDEEEIEMIEEIAMETAIDLRDATVTIEEEGHHHQANASGVEKQVIGKNNHLRRERGEVWLIGIGHDIIWYPL
jgi:hypothetical protein